VLSPGRGAEATDPEAGAINYALEPFTTNLADAGGRRILRVSMELRVSGEIEVRDLDLHRTKLRSEILSLLRSRYLADLEGEIGMQRLAADLVTRANAVLGRPVVLRVYFTDFIIQ
jgi:flagellar basal body-associated protein FliL